MATVHAYLTLRCSAVDGPPSDIHFSVTARAVAGELMVRAESHYSLVQNARGRRPPFRWSEEMRV